MSESSRGAFARRLRLAAGALLSLLLVLQVTPGTAGPQQTKKELDEARRQAERLTDQLRAEQAQRDALRADIRDLTRQISLLTAQVESLGEAIEAVQLERRKATQEINELQRTLNERARSAYINGPGTGFELVLEARSLADLSDRLGFIQALQQDDSDLAAGIITRRDQLEEHSANLLEYRNERRQLLSELKPQQAALQDRLLEDEGLIATIDDDRQEVLALVERLQKKYQGQLQAQLEAALAATNAVPGAAATGPPLQADGPLYWCPVDSPRSYVDTFGAPRPGGRTHEGNDIFAAEGTPIRAPFEGTAVEGYDGLGGIVVHVYASANADYVYNAHLSRHAGVDGQHVSPGDLIGYVGNTGNASGTSPHDHFEYHPGGGDAVDPYPYLNEVCGVNGSGG